jgi:pyrroline-5-carboxylate reductase
MPQLTPLTVTPILIAGAGRMGGAIIAGWRLAAAFEPGDLIIRDPLPGEMARAASADGARLNPPDAALGSVATVLLGVKPQSWRDAANELVPLISPGAVIISILAGIAAEDISRAFGGRPVARVMPTTAAAIGKGAASIFATDSAARARAHVLFEPLGAVVDLEDEDLMHAATAASGSAPAYLYAFIEALQSAAVGAGFESGAAARLARSTITGAAALLDATGEDPAELRRQVTSPGGTTQAALDVLTGDGGLASLLQRAVAAATARSRELGA